MQFVRRFFREWRARREGATHLSRDIQRSARDIVGPTGFVFSAAWEQMAENGDAFLKSFDPKVPPSIFVSERDLTRLNHPVPITERLIAESDKAVPLTHDEEEWGNHPPGSGS